MASLAKYKPNGLSSTTQSLRDIARSHERFGLARGLARSHERFGLARGLARSRERIDLAFITALTRLQVE